MLEGFFSDEENEILIKDFAKFINESSKKGKSMADDLEMPPVKRRQFAGLKNQGATCYLNSFYQMMFFMPEVRTLIQKLSPEFLADKKILSTFKKLMFNMQFLDVQNQDTNFMSEAFGWQNSEMLNQHDIQEAMRIIFDYFEKELVGTPFIEEFNRLLKGENQNFIECQNCLQKSIRLEEFFDIFVNIKIFGGSQFDNLNDGLKANFSNELLEGNNQYFCENCNSNQDALKGSFIMKLPVYACVYLNRFEFDLSTLQRIKISGKFSFPEKIDFGDFMTDSQENHVYQLQGVIVHRGSPYSGHYYMMAKDLENLAGEEKPSFFELNDTLVKKVPDLHYEKFFSGKESGYLLFYRKQDFQLQVQDSQIFENDPLFKEIQQINQKTAEEREQYEKMKDFIQMNFLSFEELLNKNFINKNNVQLRTEDKIENLEYQKIVFNKMKKDEIKQSISNQLKIDLNEYDFFTIQFFDNKKIYYRKKLDLTDQEDLIHNQNIIYIKKNSEILQNNFFQNFQNQNMPIWLRNNNNQFLVNNKITVQELLNLLNQNSDIEVTEKNLHLNLQGDFVNLETILKYKTLSEIFLYEIEYVIKENENLDFFNVGVISNYDLRQIQIEKTADILDLKNKINKVFNLETLNFNLLDLNNQIVDQNQKLADFKETLHFKVQQKYDDDIEILILKINSKFETQKVLEQWSLVKPHLPSKEEILDFINQKFNQQISELTFYKSNTLQEPCKRIELNKFSLKQFEIDRKYIIFVKIDQEPLHFEKIKINIFTSKNYPLENEKVLELELYNELDLQQALQEIIKICFEKEIFEHDKYEQFFYQQLTKEQKAGQFLSFKKTKIKKVFSNNNNLLIRYNKEREVIPKNSILIFFRQRNSKQKKYEQHQEKFLNQKFRRIKKNNSEKIQQEFKKILGIDENEKIIFLLADYKNLEWKILNDLQCNLKDGDEIGYLKEQELDQEDNLQTEEFLAAKIAQQKTDSNIYYPALPYQEKSFKINLEQLTKFYINIIFTLNEN